MIVVDTNVLVSGLLTGNPQAPTARIVNAMINGRCRCLLSSALLDEYRTVLMRPAIMKHHGLSADEIEELLTRIVQNAIFREPPASSRPAPDPGDNHLWALLEAEPEALLVTGDRRLLDGPIAEGRLIAPAECVPPQAE